MVDKKKAPVKKRATVKKSVTAPVAKPNRAAWETETPKKVEKVRRKKPTLADIKKLEKAKDAWDKASKDFRLKYDVDHSYINGILKKPMKT